MHQLGGVLSWIFLKRLLQLRDMFAEETQHGTPSEKDFTKTPAKYCQASEKHLELHMLLVLFNPECMGRWSSLKPNWLGHCFFLLRWSKHYLFLSLNEHRCFWQFQFDVPTEKAGAWKGEWRELPVSPIDCEMGSDEHSYCWCFRNLAQPVYPGLFTKAFFYTVGMYKTS